MQEVPAPPELNVLIWRTLSSEAINVQSHMHASVGVDPDNRAPDDSPGEEMYSLKPAPVNNWSTPAPRPRSTASCCGPRISCSAASACPSSGPTTPSRSAASCPDAPERQRHS